MVREQKGLSRGQLQSLDTGWNEKEFNPLRQCCPALTRGESRGVGRNADKANEGKTGQKTKTGLRWHNQGKVDG